MAAHICFPCHMCSSFLCPPDRPSPIFSTFSVFLNGAMLLWFVITLGAYNDQCSTRTRNWAILGLLTAAVNIGFAFYLYIRFAYKVQNAGGQAGVSKAAVHLFLYDWGVCMYILFCVWIVVWMVLAGTAAFDAPSTDACEDLITGGIVIFIVYFVLGGFFIVLSLCTECCRTPSWRKHQVQQYNPQVAAHVAGQQQYPYGQPPQQHQQQYGGPMQQQPMNHTPQYQPTTYQPTDPYHGQPGFHQQPAPAKKPGLMSAFFGPSRHQQQPQGQHPQGQHPQGPYSA